MNAGVRSFLAIELAEEVRVRALAARDVVSAVAPAWRDEKWVQPVNLHITVKFFGNLSEPLLGEICTSLAADIGGISSFDLDLVGGRAVPGQRRCSMLWAAFADESGGYERLVACVNTVAGALGMPGDDRPPRPHVTLVRARRPKRVAREAVESLGAILATPPLSMSVRSATLFASTLTRSGPEYRVIDSWALSNSAAHGQSA